MTKNLSKSQFTRGMQCPKSLWLYRERKDLQDPVSPEQQAVFDQGTEVGILAQSWIKGGVLIAADHDKPEEALEQTKAAIEAGAKVIYEAAFLHDDVLVRVDILARNPEGGWDFYEVKSTTKMEDYHLLDVAIQLHVLRGSGLKVHRAHLAHLSPDYVRVGALNLDQLFLPVYVNADIEPILPNVPARLAQMKADNAKAEPPEVGIGAHCTKPHDCSFIGHCWKHIPDYSVFNLAGARMDKKMELWNAGIKTVDAIPEWSGRDADKTYKLTAFQNAQRIAAKSGLRFVDTKGIRALLKDLVYPQYFIDFEAVNPAVPMYDGMRPYQQMPFQASIHVRRRRGAALEHHEYLADGRGDPRPALIDFLSETIDVTGSVIAYSKSYEGNIIKQLAMQERIGSVVEARLLSAERRLWDVADAFRKAFYVLPEFKGRWSIKEVLPAIFPEMKYEGLAIKNGAEAMTAYTRLMTDATLTPEQRSQIMSDLREYCGQDTMAMVKLLDHLEETVGALA